MLPVAATYKPGRCLAATRHGQLVFDTAVHTKHVGIKIVGGLRVFLSRNHMTQTLAAGNEFAPQGASGMKGAVGLHPRRTVDLGGVTAGGIREFEQTEHVAFAALGIAGHPKVHVTFSKLCLHGFKRLGAGDPPTHVLEIVTAVGVHHNAVMHFIDT